MRLIALVFLCIPLYTIGQETSEFSDVVTSDMTDASDDGQRAASAQVQEGGVDFGIKGKPSTVEVHPNPSSSDLYVTLRGNGNTGKVIVYDILGNVLVEGESFQLNGGSHTWSYDVSMWHPGTYVVRVLQDDSVVKSLRFIKN